MAKGQQKKTTETASNKTDHSNGNTSNDDTIVDDEYMNTNSRVNAMTMKIDMWLLKVFKLRKPIDLCGVEVLYIEFNELAAELINEESPDKAALAQLFSYQSKVDQMFSYAKAVEKLQSAVLTMEEEISFSPNWKDLEEACELIKHTERKFPFSDVHHNNWLEKLYEWKEKIEQQSVSSNRSQGSINSYTTAQRGDEFRVKIEKKKLAKFNGDPIDYYKFRHDILHYIIKNPQIQGRLNKLTEIQDLLPNHHRYLLNRVIRNEAGIEDALKKLDDFYASEHQIIPALKNKIKLLPHLSQRATVNDWTTWLETVVIIRDTLAASNLLHEDYNMTTYILYKVDDVYQQQIDGDHKIKLAQLEEFLERGAARKAAISGRLDENPWTTADKPRSMIRRPINNVMMTTNNKCFFQDGDHKTDECKLSGDARRQFLFTNRLCFGCGESGHNGRECPKILKCNHCQRRHASQFCFRHNQPSVLTPTMPTSSNANNEASESSSQPTLLIPAGRSLHKTLTTTINGRKIRVVFDDGAGTSFISSKVAHEWNLVASRAEPIFMDTLSNAKPTATGHQMVHIEMPTWGGQHENLGFRLNDKLDQLQFHCIPIDVQKQLRQQGIDFQDEQRPVDMLIGLDNINKIQLPDERRVMHDVIAKRTTMGWVVFGVTNRTNVLLSYDQSLSVEPALDVDIEDEDKEAMEKFLENYCTGDSVKYDQQEKRYSVKLPFIPNVKVQPNFDAAKKQLWSMVKHMTNERRTGYQELIDDLVQNKIVEQVAINPDDGYHMPHFVVTRNDKNTTKMRIVFNASNGTQPLNKAIFKGVTAWYIIRSLLFFRLQTMAVISDIKSAFHNIAIQPEHKKFVKFLWIDNDENTVCYQFNRLPFGLSSSPFILYAVVMHHLKQYRSKYPQTVNAIINGLYVDDLIFSANNQREVEQIKCDSQMIFAEASMMLRKWRSSDKALNDRWGDGLAETKVLGVEWTEDDQMRVLIPEFTDGGNITKRALLKYHASIYDPFGFVLATTLKLKMMIHESWKLGYEWDDPLSPDLQKKARKIIHEIKELDQFSFPRRIFDKSVEEFDLMVFVDASQHAIGIASYLTNGQQLTLIYAKSKLIKPRKIVSAELLALSAGANTAKTLGDLVNARHIILFSDSMDNVKRLEEDMNKYPYPVAVHLFNIKSKISDIRHIRGEINPADAFTRGVTVDELKKLHRLNYHDIIELQDVVVGVGLTVNGSSEKYDISKFDLDSKRPYNQWIELVQQQSDDWKKSIDETMNELTILIKINQRRFLDDHFDKHIPTFCDDQGLVRCLTRLENSDLSYDEKYPIALPTCEFTLALMERTHENDEHGSVNYTLANFRMKYFTPRARQQFIKIKNRCSKCRQLRAKPLQVSLGNPPSTRLDRSHPFEHIGVDIFELKTDPKTIGMIFTCCVTRAVHFEVLENMTAECVCDAFQIFAALRRVPSTVYSDNGTNFKRLGNMFNEAYTVLKDNFQWRFNTPAAPFRGGFFESLIKSMKKGFYSIMWKKDIKPTMVRLVLYRIQSLMNARPLIHDNSTIVTPNHLMYGASSNGSLAPPRRGVQPSCLLKYWRGTQRLVDGAWKTYRDIYLKSLRNYHQNIKHYQYVQVGDEVLLVDKGLPVSLWTTGNIVETIPDARGVIRTYRVKAGDRIFERPAQRLAPLEAAFERREDM
ncbi:hypothetical protein DERF_016721 [Dermatophagoides farinae]|uniref:Uncharacterized protein n=1 Tax=Dermatophagoides farinae TaxID=6954 RepID=A0A922HEY7_DERFA|nr:hypothetical protein DERF_016721 [Dermatophagoides farinae]